MKLKILSLEFWMMFSDPSDSTAMIQLEDTLECAKEITPILNRNGYYLDRETNFCWFEWAGKAFKYEPESFKYELSLLNHRPLTDKESQAISFISREFNFKEIDKLYYLDRSWKRIRECYRDATKFWINRK